MASSGSFQLNFLESTQKSASVQCRLALAGVSSLCFFVFLLFLCISAWKYHKPQAKHVWLSVSFMNFMEFLSPAAYSLFVLCYLQLKRSHCYTGKGWEQLSARPQQNFPWCPLTCSDFTDGCAAAELWPPKESLPPKKHEAPHLLRKLPSSLENKSCLRSHRGTLKAESSPECKLTSSQGLHQEPQPR